jgi:hypothetical protein
VTQITVQIVHLEQKPDLIIWRLAGELVHRVDEFLQRDGPRIVLIEDLEHTFREERLEKSTTNLITNATTF